MDTALAGQPLSRGEYRYRLELFTNHGERLGQVAVFPDWEPALECASFEAVRRGLARVSTAAPHGSVEPVWHRTLQSPYVGGFRIGVPTPTGEMVSKDVPTSYLYPLARAASQEFVERGDLKAGDSFAYLVSAYPVPPTAGAAAVGDLTVEEIDDPLPLRVTSLAGLRSRADVCGDCAADDVPVFIPRFVIEDSLELARRAGDLETAGVLIGHLHRDSDAPEVFVEITTLIPAPHTQAEASKVTFTAESWTAVHAAIALRGRNETPVGWMHSHPDFCRKCPEERRANCLLSSAFFSADDVHLHRACFSRAFNVALLVSDSLRTGLTWSLYGWRSGTVQQRGCYVL